MKVFIHRPVLSIVISLVIVVAGLLAMTALPIAQYPQITPPTIVVSTQYVGASADVVEQTVAAPIEQQVNGAQNMIYMQSKSTNDGKMVLTVTFDVGTNLDIASVDVQNRVAQANSSLPPDVVQNGVTVKKQSSQVLMYICVYSPNGEYDGLFLSNYCAINILDQLARVPGVGVADMSAGRQDYSMRLWVQPDKLAKLGLTTQDIQSAIKDQNVQAAAGSVGAPPMPVPVDFQYTVNVKGRLDEVKEFENIIVRTNSDGSIVRVRDVARTELGGQTYNTVGRLNGKAAAPIGIFQLPDANALNTAKLVRAKMAELKKAFPPGVDYQVTLDTTDFVNASIDEVISTLRDAIVLVIIVVFVFLGNVRATLVPMLAVPVSLIGTFAAFVALGFSINMLTLFGLVLAVGIVVDDAIVVVEAVEHHIEHGLTPLEATERAMAEVSGPVMAIALVLCSVFVPVAFMGGITGMLYQQFAITLAVSVCLSALVALTLTPALCRMLLRPRKKGRGPIAWFLAGFNWIFDRVTSFYVFGVKLSIKAFPVTLLLLGLIYYGAYHLQITLPTGFLPLEDNGYFFISVTLPDAASMSRTDAVLKKIEKTLMETEGVQAVITLGGYGILSGTNNSNYGSLVATLKPWDKRPPDQVAFVLIRKLQKQLAEMPEARIMVVNPPPIPGLGTSGGFTFELQDRGGHTINDLAQVGFSFIEATKKNSDLAGVYTFFSPRVPRIQLYVDRDKVKILGIPLNDVFQVLQANLGGLFVNQFNKFGRTWRVYIQAEAGYRRTPNNIGDLYVRAADGSMIPLRTLTAVQTVTSVDTILRYNLYRCMEINGGPSLGKSTGQALAAMEKTASTNLPAGYGYEWTGTAYQEKLSSGAQGMIFALAILFVFLFLAAQYESWAVPFAVLLGIPVGVCGAYIGTAVIKMDNNVYVQIGLVMLIGLAAKNAILIVEFAKEKYEKENYKLFDAAVEGAKLRFRPIMMTSFAFILGVVPLVLASGAASISRKALGTAVFGGMVASSSLGIFFVPMLYVLVSTIAGVFGGKKKEAPVPVEAETVAVASAKVEKPAVSAEVEKPVSVKVEKPPSARVEKPVEEAVEEKPPEEPPAAPSE